MNVSSVQHGHECQKLGSRFRWCQDLPVSASKPGSWTLLSMVGKLNKASSYNKVYSGKLRNYDIVQEISIVNFKHLKFLDDKNSFNLSILHLKQ